MIAHPLVRALRHAAVPLAWYYAITLVLPFANGAAALPSFREHALVVLALPPALIALACAIRESPRVMRRLCRTISPPRP